MNILESLRALMEPVLEGARMERLGPDYQLRRAEAAERIRLGQDRRLRENEEAERAKRKEMNDLILAMRAAAEQQDMPSIPVSEAAGGVGPPAPAPRPTDALVGPDGQTMPLGPRRYRSDVMAELRDITGIKAGAEADARVGANVEQERQIRSLPISPEERERMEAEAKMRARVAAAGRPPVSGFGLTPVQQANQANQLRRLYNAATKTAQEVTRQFAVMSSAYDRLARGENRDLNATTQAIVTTFNKIMDPASVVRESEYARSPEGQALIETLQGKVAALSRGGPGLTPQSLKEFVDLARMFEQRATATITRERDLALESADIYGIPRELIVGRAGAAGGGATTEEADFDYDPRTGQLVPRR